MFSHAVLQILWYCLMVSPKEKEKVELDDEWGQFVEFD
jgi:hypothetical protein